MIGNLLNRKYKDTLFTMYFGKEYKGNALALYNALNHSNYSDLDALSITTIDSVIMLGYKNDLSFVIDGVLSIIEQQSTINPNMPLRGLIYFAMLYNQMLEDRGGLYSSKLIPLPTPQYTVLYNGTRSSQEKYVMRLSDAFIRKDIAPDLECTATVYNINQGNNETFLESCRPLNDYSRFVEKYRHYKGIYPSAEDAIRVTIRECIAENIMADFLKDHHEEIICMCIEEFDAEKYIDVLVSENIEKGIEIGIEKGMEKGREIGVTEGMEKGIMKMLAPMAAALKGNGISVENGLDSLRKAYPSVPEEELRSVWNLA